MPDFETIRLALGLGEDVSDEDVAARVVSLQAEADAGRTAVVALADREFDAAFDEAVAKGTFVPAQRDSARKLFDLDPDACKTLMSAAQPAPSQDEQGHRGERYLSAVPGDGEGDVDEDRAELAQRAERLADEKGISLTEAAIQLTQGAA